MIKHAPKLRFLKSVTIQPAGSDIILGHQELAQHPGAKSAEAAHLNISLQRDGFYINNVAQYKKVDAKSTAWDTILLKRKTLFKNDAFYIGHTEFVVKESRPGRLTIQETSSKRSVTWKDARLVFDKNEPVYTQGRFSFDQIINQVRKWIKWKTRLYSLGQKEMYLFSIGGRINCPDKWSAHKVPFQSVRVMYKAGKFILAPGNNNRVAVLFRGKEKKLTGFSDIGLKLDGRQGLVKRIILGKTYYRVDFGKKSLTLTAVGRQDAWTRDQALPQIDANLFDTNKTAAKEIVIRGLEQKFETLEWMGAGLLPAAWFKKHSFYSAMILFFTLTGCVGIFFHHQYVRRARKKFSQPLGLKFTSSFSILGTGLLLIFFWRTADIGTESLLFLQWLVWTAATIFMAAKSRLEKSFGWLWVCLIFMCGSGTLFLVQLGAGAQNLYWISFAQKHIFVMTGMGIILQVLNLLSSHHLASALENLVTSEARGFKLLRWGLGGIALGFMLLQLFFGNEGGLWNFQPAEGAKLFFIITAAFAGLHLGELRRHHSDLYQARPLKFIFDILIILFLACIAIFIILMGVRDISPVVIMGILFFAWIWQVAPHPWRTTPSRKFWRFFILALMVGICFLSHKYYTNPQSIPEFIPQRDRFLVWANPYQHPHSGAQVLKSMELAGVGAWTGAEPSFLGQNQSIYRLPAVQDDFIAGYILYKFGGMAGIALALCQIFYVILVLTISKNTGQWAETAGNFRQRQTGKLLSMILFLLTWVHITQWTISWGNVLGLLPVMGQPMTWISAANSHMVFIGLPALAAAFFAHCFEKKHS